MNLYTLCYPKLTSEDRRFIDEYRNEYDIPFRDVVAPHFTMVFGCAEVSESVYREHVHGVAQSQGVIRFTCRYAMPANDDSNNNYYVFLVPDEGYSELSKLHDQLYRGVLAPYLRLDIPYVPHIGIATIPDAPQIKALCDGLNSSGVIVSGEIDTISVCSYDGSKITDLETFQCQT